jgi:DNA-binding NarL/FixJ family response regulator
MDRLKLLIVEDEALIALQLKMKLRRAGFDVCESAVSGAEAITLSRSEKPDVILMDIRLAGEMDGIEAARQIGGFSPARIIFTTGNPDSATKTRAMDLKPAAFLIKPVEVHSIMTVLQKA